MNSKLLQAMAESEWTEARYYENEPSNPKRLAALQRYATYVVGQRLCEILENAFPPQVTVEQLAAAEHAYHLGDGPAMSDSKYEDLRDLHCCRCGHTTSHHNLPGKLPWCRGDVVDGECDCPGFGLRNVDAMCKCGHIYGWHSRVSLVCGGSGGHRLLECPCMKFTDEPDGTQDTG